MTDSSPCAPGGLHSAGSSGGARFLLKLTSLGLLLLLPAALRAELQGAAEMPVVVHGEDLDLGTLWAGSMTHRSVMLENVSDREVTITSLRASCPPIHVVPESLVLAAGERREVGLVINMTPPRPFVDDPDVRPFACSLLIEVQGLTERPSPPLMQATVRTLLMPEVSVVRFEEPLVAGHAFPERTVRITAAEPLVSLQAAVDDLPATLRIDPINARTFSLAIRLREDLPPGMVRFDVPVRAELVGGEMVAVHLLSVLGRIEPEVAAIPPEVQWGIVPAGRTARTEVALRSMIGVPFEIAGITVEPPEETIRFAVHEAGDGRALVIEALVEDDRIVNATVRVETIGADGRAGVTPIPVSYRGVVPRKE